MSAITITPRTISSDSGTPRGADVPASAREAVPRVRLRITRRGRRVLGAVVALVVAAVVGAILLAGPGAVASNSSSTTTFEYVTVDGGDTLWQVASEIAPTKDPRDVISDIVRLNNLSSTEVAAGQSLAVPTQYSN